MSIALSIPEDTETQCLMETVEIHSKSCLLLLAAHGKQYLHDKPNFAVRGLHLLVYRHSSHL